MSRNHRNVNLFLSVLDVFKDLESGEEQFFEREDLLALKFECGEPPGAAPLSTMLV